MTKLLSSSRQFCTSVETETASDSDLLRISIHLVSMCWVYIEPVLILYLVTSHGYLLPIPPLAPMTIVFPLWHLASIARCVYKRIHTASGEPRGRSIQIVSVLRYQPPCGNCQFICHFHQSQHINPFSCFHVPFLMATFWILRVFSRSGPRGSSHRHRWHGSSIIVPNRQLPPRLLRGK